jgi:hypothetical protein
LVVVVVVEVVVALAEVEGVLFMEVDITNPLHSPLPISSPT